MTCPPCQTFVLWWAWLAILPCDQAFANSEGCSRKYTPSSLEDRWVSNIGKWQSQDWGWDAGCKAVREDSAWLKQWLKELNGWDGATPLNEDVFSYHVVACNHSAGPPRRVYIEPLAASLRHPLQACGGQKEGNRLLFATNWLTFPLARNIPHRHAFFFDLGATYYNAGFSGYSDSLAWFVDSFHQRGWRFNQIFAWEKRPLNHVEYWERVPTHMKPRLHFFNAPCSSNVTSDMNPLNLMKLIAKKEDYVVFKLDIDHNEVEVDLILQILRTPPHRQLIDEIFWENHVKGSPTQWFGWGDLSLLTGPVGDLNQSYHAFQDLRRMGIRAHSWV